MKYRIVYDNSGHCTIEAGSNLEAAEVGNAKDPEKACQDSRADYRLSDNGCIVPEGVLPVVGFAMEGEYEQD